jgi:hypothetical protein
MGSVLLAGKHIAHTAHGEDALGCFGVDLDGGADAAHVHVDGPVKRFKFAAAHGFHDLVSREYAACAFGQGHQQVVLVRGQLAILPLDADAAGVAVDLERAKLHGRLARLRVNRPIRQGHMRLRRMARMRASNSRGSKGLGR